MLRNTSLVKALLNKYISVGLRLMEMEKYHLIDVHDIVEKIYQHPGRFILYCNDLIIYATSNRRHMMAEFMQNNLDT